MHLMSLQVDYSVLDMLDITHSIQVRACVCACVRVCVLCVRDIVSLRNNWERE